MSVFMQRMGIHPTYNRFPLKMLKAIPAGFPLALHDDMLATEIFDNIQSAGEDLRVFSDEAMTTELPLEICETTPASDILRGFARITSALSINDYIYLRTTIRGGESAPAADSTYGSEAVWSDYALVMHGHDWLVDASGNLADATDDGTPLAKSGGDLLNGWGAVGYGDFEGTGDTDCTVFPATPGEGNTQSQCLIMYKSSSETLSWGRLYQYNGVAIEAGKYGIDNQVWQRRKTTSGTHEELISTDDPLTDDAWIQLSLNLDWLSDPLGFKDGVAFSSPNPTAGTGTKQSASGTFGLANAPGNTICGDIRIAEFRSREDNVPDATWYGLEWDCFNDPGALAVIEAGVQV